MAPTLSPFRKPKVSGALSRGLIAALVVAGIGWGGMIHAANQSVQGAKKPEELAFDGDAPTAILVEAKSGSVLFEKNADELRAPSSMMKLMTAEVVFHALKDGKLKLTDEYRISENAWRRGGAPSGTNFPNRVYENPPDFVESLAQTMLGYGIKPEVEVFDLAMLYNAANLVKRGLIADPPHVQFVLGIPNALPARRSIFDFLRRETAELLPRATWVAAGIGRHQWEVNQWCLAEGGHCRTGLEDNLRATGDRLAASNAELVKKIVDACARFGRRPAAPAEARRILGLRPA